jgi:uncharacterized protein
MGAYAWIKDDPVGMEHAELEIVADGVRARSVAIGSEPVPYRLDVELAVGPGWLTEHLVATARGDGWTTSLELSRGASGAWQGGRRETGVVPTAVRRSVPDDAVAAEAIPADVVDVDVQYSPVTNLMPSRRLGLELAGATGSFVMAWISVPSLAITLDPQRYTVLGADDGDRCVRFESGDGFFAAVLRCDDDGVIRDYPGIARRIG